MSKSKFTPGPWAVFYDHPDVPENIAFIRPASSAGYDPGTEIATVYGCGPEALGADAARASARVLAAAPELLEALELALKYWADRQQRYKNRFPVWIQSAHAAIAKARIES